MIISFHNKICTSCVDEHINIIENFDNFILLCNSSRDYFDQFADEISNNYSKLQINRAISNVDSEQISKLMSIFEKNKKRIYNKSDSQAKLLQSSFCSTKNAHKTNQDEDHAYQSVIHNEIIEFKAIINNSNDDDSIKKSLEQNSETINNNNSQNVKKRIFMEENQIYSLYNNAIAYLNSCYLNLKKNIPTKCIFGTVQNIHDIYNNLVSYINDTNNDSISIQKIINDIFQINDSLNNIINFINILKSAQFNLLTFIEKSLNLLEKLNINQFKVNCSKGEISLQTSQLTSILIDFNQDPIFVFELKPGSNQQNPIDSFFKILTDCFRSFHKKTNLDTFIFKYYERRINHQETNNNLVYIDDFIKKDFSSFIEFLIKISKNHFSKIKTIDSIRKDVCERINRNYKIVQNEIIPTINLYEPNPANNWKIILNVEKYHFLPNKKTFINTFKQIFDNVFQNEKEEQIISKQKMNLSNILQGMFIKLSEEYQIKGEYYFYKVIFRNAIKKLLKEEDFSQQLQLNLKKNAIDNKLFVIKNYCDFSINEPSKYKLNIDYNFHFVLQKIYGNVRESIQEREINIFKKKYSKFIVNCIDEYENEEKNVFIPYFPYKTLYFLINQNKISSFSYVDRIIIILEIATALNDLHTNNEYHGNLSSESIFINSSKDAYIGSFAYDRKCEENLSKPPIQLYYRSPNNYIINEENISENQLNDIYSFGVLVYEILLGESTINKMKNLSTGYKRQIFENNYYEFLFKNNEDVKILDEDSYDSKGDSLIGFKNIIEKCMKKDPNERYQINEIINYIKNTSIYTKNMEEIEYRFNNAINSTNYQCNMSDIVENYLYGNEESLSVIKKANETYCRLFGIEEISYENDDIIKHVLNSFGVKPSEDSLSIIKHLISLFIKNDETIINNKYSTNESTDTNWLIMLNKIKYHLDNETEKIVSILDSIFLFYIYYIGNDAQNDFYKSFLYLTDENKDNQKMNWKEFLMSIQENNSEHSKEDNRSLADKFKDKLDEVNNKNFIFDLIFQVAIRSILNQRLFSDKFHELLQSIHSYIELYYVRDSLSFNEIDSSYKLFVDSDFNFVLQKNYNQNIKKYIRDREKNIMKENYSKFIVHCEEDFQENKLIIPYFPCGNLDWLIRRQNTKTASNMKIIELTSIDKTVIALEIAIALKDLHSNNEYHGNLASQFIFISSTKDAYIGAIAYDRKLEIDATKPRGPFYYRPPEITYFVHSDQQEENIREQQLYDIYSFGVLIHELFTEVAPEKRMGNKSRDERLHLLKDIYEQFLLSDENIEYLKEDTFDIKGTSLFGFQNIISKCIKKDPKERYQAFDLIINDIKKLPIYINNQEEIEYRIENATSSADYQCTMCDLVESFYLGNENSLFDIEKSLSLFLKISSDDCFSSFHIEGDLIKTIFDIFEIKYKIPDDDLLILNKEFDKIIQNNIKIKSNQIEKLTVTNQLLSLSINENYNKSNDINYIIPISSLDKFIQQNQKYPKLAPIWAYFIANELLLIHSKSLFHGDLSLKSIGIYYNQKTKTFIPSMILYYLIHKQNNNDNVIINSNGSHFDFIRKMQKKDIKNIIKIIIELIGKNDAFENISDLTLNSITLFLYNYIMKDTENAKIFKENLNYSYQSCRISFLNFGDIFNQIKEKNFLTDDLFIFFPKILKEINDFLDNEMKDIKIKIHKPVTIFEIDFQSHIPESLIALFNYTYEKYEKYILLKVK